jgi:Tfp pilus assembly protein PilF
VLLQFGHRFDAARADLRAVLDQQPGNAEAWAWLAAISLVQADYAQARQACERLQTLASSLLGAACKSQIDSLSGRSAEAASALTAALARSPSPDAEEALWALTRLAEAEERRGDNAAAEAAYRRALALGLTDGYLLAAYADFLLDQGRPAEVLVLLKGNERSDLLLLRLALAAKALGSPQLAGWQAELGARFDAARLRGDTLHDKEEARFALALLGQPSRALKLASANYALQREPADARVLLEAAIAARQPAAAEPVLEWMAESDYDGVIHRRLVQSLKAGS